MSKLSLNKFIINDDIGLKYLKELIVYSLPLKEKMKEIVFSLDKKTTYEKLLVVESEYNSLVADFRKLRKSYNSINKNHEFYLYDLLYLNGVYTFLNCYMNNGTIESDFNKDISKLKLNLIDVLQTLANRYKYSIYNKKEITNELYNEDLNIPINISNSYILFVKLQKKISLFNEKELFPLFAKISSILSIKNYAPKEYIKFRSKVKRILNHSMRPGLVSYKFYLFDFLDNKVYKLDKSVYNILSNVFIKKETPRYIYTIYSQYVFLRNSHFILRFNLNKELFKLYKKRNVSKDLKGILHLELTNKCNYNCKFCFNRNENRLKDISLTEYKRIINLFSNYGKFYTIIFGGEPLLNKETISIMSYLNEKKFPIEIFTNASLISDDFLQKISDYNIIRFRISLDGNKNVNDFLRGVGSFEKTISGIQKIKTKTKFKVHISVTLSKINVRQIRNIFKIAKKLNVDGIGFGPVKMLGKARNHSNIIISIKRYFGLNKEIKMLSREFDIDAGMASFCEGPTSIFFNNIKLNKFEKKYFKYLLPNPCGIGFGMYYLRSDGLLSSCVELTSEKHCIKPLGVKNLNLDSCFEKNINSLRFVPECCIKCNFYYICFGSCKADILRKYGSLFVCDIFEKNNYNYIFNKLVDGL